jgi:hypothetical protein
MLYKFNANYINLAEIASLSCTASNDTEYPYTLTVFLKDGNKYGVRYTTEQARNAEAWNIMQAHNKTDPEPVSRYEVETIVSSELEKVRRDFRRLREVIREGNHGN